MVNEQKKVVAIIQARMGSTRLPGKVLMEVDGRTMLGYLIERVTSARSLADVIVATSTRPENDAIQEECLKLGIGCFRGEEDDVLNRYLQASQWIKADAAVRITGDSVLIDPLVIDYIVERYVSCDYDCATNYTTHSFPGGFILSVFSKEALDKADKLALSGWEREHVILAFLRYRDHFKVIEVDAPQKWQAYPLSLALDTPGDYSLIAEIIQGLSKDNKHFGLEDILAILRQNPRLNKLAKNGGY